MKARLCSLHTILASGIRNGQLWTREEAAIQDVNNCFSCHSGGTAVVSSSSDRHDHILLHRGLTDAPTSSLGDTSPNQRGLGLLKETLVRLETRLQVDSAAYASALRFCGNAKALQEGSYVHDLLVKREADRDVFMVSLLVQMYGNCGALGDAFSLFSSMHQRNVYSWNFIIRACAREGETHKVFELFKQMQQEGVMPNKVTYVSIFDACASQATVASGDQMHARIVESAIESDVVVGTALLNMYGKFNSLNDAIEVFDKIHDHDVMAWTLLISVFSQHMWGKEALHLFDQMLQEGMMPNKVTYISILDACASHGALQEGTQMHSRIANNEFESDIVVGNALINMYDRCDCLEDAKRMFQKMEARNVISWTAMISMNSQQGNGKEALQMYDQMQQSGVLPDNIMLTTTLGACSSLGELADCKRMHVIILEKGLENDVVVGTALVNVYGKAGSVELAKMAFNEVLFRNVVSWNAMIAAYTQNGQGKEAYYLFERMQQEGILPNKVTFVSIFDACAIQGALFEGERVHASILHSTFEPELDLENAVVNMYGKCGSLGNARAIFDAMSERNLVSWNAMIAVYARNGEGKEALKIFDRLQQEGVQPDKITFVSVLSACADEAALTKGQQVHTYIRDSGFDTDIAVATALVNMYGKRGRAEDARKVFDKMDGRNLVSWNAMLGVYALDGQAKMALQLFDQLQQDGIVPDCVMLATVLSACAAQSALAEGSRVHMCILDCGYSADVLVGTSIINMYGKCGSAEDAQRVFDSMSERSVVSWNAMIAVYAQHGLGKVVLMLFERMQTEGITPNDITFVIILAACSHAGLVDEACKYFSSMVLYHRIPPLIDHFVCLIDLLGRVGQLEEAEHLINGMPFQPTAASFMALLGACRYKADVELGEHAAKHVCTLDPDNFSPYLILSNLYAAAGRASNVVTVKNTRGKGTTKQVARGLIDDVLLKNQIYLKNVELQMDQSSDKCHIKSIT